MRSKRFDMLVTEQLVFCVMTHVFLYRTSYSDCEFPRQWWGRWHSTGIGELVIRANEISTKGTCYEQYREYFLVENRNEHCHQCMMIVRRHPNIIQYRESYCIGREALQSICGQMRVEGFGAIYTLVRDAASPVACPFQKAFHFTYNNQSGGFCRSPTSYAHQCSTGTMLRFYFRQCRHCMHTYESDVEFECLATWKDGNDHFAYGIFIGENFLNREESYRCFIYQKTGSVVYMAISSDATCRGLRSPKEGPLVLELTEDVYGWPTPRCSFPSWLASTSWIDTSGLVVYTFNAANDVIAVHSQRKNDFSVAHARAVFKCLKTDGRPGNESSSTSASTTGNTTTGGDVITLDTTNITILAHVLEKCQSRHRCLRIQRRHLSLMHIYTGSYVRDSKELCTDEHFTREQSQHDLLVTATLSSSDRRGSRCPTKKGRYLALRTAGKCQPELRIGCSQQDQMEVVSQCQAEQPLVQLACLFSWRESDVTFLIARKIDTNESICFNLRRQDSRLMLTATEQCSQYDTDRHAPLNTVYVFQSTRERCQGQTAIDDDNEDEDPRDNNNRDVQRDIDSDDEAIAPTWHLSDKTPSKRIEESSPRLSNASRSLLPTDRIRTRIILALLTTMLLTTALTHTLPK